MRHFRHFDTGGRIAFLRIVFVSSGRSSSDELDMSLHIERVVRRVRTSAIATATAPSKLVAKRTTKCNNVCDVVAIVTN